MEKEKEKVIRLPHPISANQYWRRHGHMIYVSPAAKKFKEQVKWICKAEGVDVIDGPVTLELKYHPKLRKDGEAYQQRQDIDNTIKVTCDSLIGVAYHDDRQIVRVVAEVSEPVNGGGLSVVVKPYERK